MNRWLLAAAVVASATTVAHTDSKSALLVVTATVVSTCRVNVPPTVDRSGLSTLPVAITCARRGAAARVQRPPAARTEGGDAVLTINF